jgi:tRNA U55 pseudouridine synthase TruB
VRSIATALGGHCTTLRRTAVGPFAIAEAADVDTAPLLPAAVALGRLPDEALERVALEIRSGVLALDEPSHGSAA